MNGPNRNWNFLCWNVRGINSDAKWNAIRHKIEESSCSIFCLQETKREFFYMAYVKKFCPRRFDKFAFALSRGVSGGIFVGWNSARFGALVEQQTDHALVIKFTACLNSAPFFSSQCLWSFVWTRKRCLCAMDE